MEVQLSVTDRKRNSWPAYATGLRARMRCPVPGAGRDGERIGRPLGPHAHRAGRTQFLDSAGARPSAVPAVFDQAQADAQPELAVLSAIAHGRDPDVDTARRIAFGAMRASLRLDADRVLLYHDSVLASLSEAARKSLQAMDTTVSGCTAPSATSRPRTASPAETGPSSGRAAAPLKRRLQPPSRYSNNSAPTRNALARTRDCGRAWTPRPALAYQLLSSKLPAISRKRANRDSKIGGGAVQVTA